MAKGFDCGNLSLTVVVYSTNVLYHTILISSVNYLARTLIIIDLHLLLSNKTNFSIYNFVIRIK